MISFCNNCCGVIFSDANPASNMARAWAGGGSRTLGLYICWPRSEKNCSEVYWKDEVCLMFYSLTIFCGLLFSATSFLWSFTLLNYQWIRPLVISEQYCNEFNYLPILGLVYTFRLYSFDLFVQRLRDPTVSSSACPGKQFLSPCKKKSTQASRSVFSFSVIVSKRKHKCVVPEDVHVLLAMLVTNCHYQFSTSHTFL